MRIAITGLVALAVAMGIGRFAFTPILPMMQADAGTTLAQGGWLAAANYAGYLVGALTAVRLAWPVRGVIRGALATVAVSTLLMAWSDALAMALLLRFLAGVASAWALVFASAAAMELLAADRSPHGRRDTGILFAGVGSGIALAGLACYGLQAAGASSDAAWLACAGLAAVGTAVAWNGWPAKPAASPGHPDANGSVTAPGATRMIASYGLFGLGYIVPATFLPAMARDVMPDPRLYGLSWPLFGIAAAASTLLAARFGGNIDHRRLWQGGHVVMAIGVAVPVLLPGGTGIALAALLVGGTLMVVTMAAMQEARAAMGDRARPLIAAMTAAFAAGQVAGPILVSIVAALRWSTAPVLLAAAAGLLIGAALLFPTTREMP